MGGWRPGQDPELDKAVETVPVVYDVLHQSGADNQTGGAFDYLAAQLKAAQMGAASDVTTE